MTREEFDKCKIGDLVIIRSGRSIHLGKIAKVLNLPSTSSSYLYLQLISNGLGIYYNYHYLDVYKLSPPSPLISWLPANKSK